jgi:hypothetical protein
LLLEVVEVELTELVLGVPVVYFMYLLMVFLLELALQLPLVLVELELGRT